MKLRRAPLMAAISILLTLGLTVPEVFAQLPQTNMGKFVHQPGDNQYAKEAQTERHPPPPPPVISRPAGFMGVGGTGVYRPVRKARRDPTIDPIPADEPIPIAGFPPLPDRPDLPVTLGGWTGGGSGGGGSWLNNSGNRPSGGGGGGEPSVQGMHQHYKHYSPGAFMPQQSSGGGGGGGGAPPGMGGAAGGQGPTGSRGYYRCQEVAPPKGRAQMQGDMYATQGNMGGPGGPPGMSAPGYNGVGPGALKALGKEPKLSDRNEQGSAPEAPQPVVVSQPTTQDLSLPEDDFQYASPQKPSAAGKVGKRIAKNLLRPVNSATRRFGMSLW